MIPRTIRKRLLGLPAALQYRGLGFLIPSPLYLKCVFRYQLGYRLNLIKPVTFNEKLQWLKLHDKNPRYPYLVDKYEAKKQIGALIGGQYIIPALGVWDRFEDIDFDKLPRQFVLKCTHDSGGLAICRDKDTWDLAAAREKITRSLDTNYYWAGREWPYKRLRPRVLAEVYMQNSSQEELIDYKFFCFHGNPAVILVCSDRFSAKGLREDFYDQDWNHLDMRRASHPNADQPHPAPKNLALMQQLARKCAKDIPFVRVDFYEINRQVYFGEMTFFPASGFEGWIPDSWDRKLGEMLQIDSVCAKR